jgi:subtilisin-like proprotein convertase family protein
VHRPFRSLASASFAIAVLVLLAPNSAATVFNSGLSSEVPVFDASSTQPGTSYPYPVEIEVAGLSGSVTDLSVTLNRFSHTCHNDVDVVLQGPTGAHVAVMSDTAGCPRGSPAERTWTFSDSASGSLPDAGPPPDGTYRPTNVGNDDSMPAPAPSCPCEASLLTSFKDTSPNGTWKLWIADPFVGDHGVLAGGWTLNITTGSGTRSFSSAQSRTIALMDRSEGILDSVDPALPYPSEIAVSGLTGVVADVNVRLNEFQHTCPSDIDAVLVSPAGRRAMLMSDVDQAECGGPVRSATLTFDDAAQAPIPDAGPLASGTYTPTDVQPTTHADGDAFLEPAPRGPHPAALSAFNGSEPNGTWRLFLIDEFDADVGVIAGGWDLDLATAQPPRPAAPPEPSPELRSYRLGSSRFYAALSGPTVKTAIATGTKVSYLLSEAATVTFTVVQRVRGRTKRKGSFAQQGKAGANSFRFMGRLRRKALRPGNYRLVAVARDTAGNRSAARSRKFTIVRRKRRQRRL